MDLNAQMAALQATIDILTKQYDKTATKIDTLEDKISTKLDTMQCKTDSTLNAMDIKLDNTHETLIKHDVAITNLQKAQSKQEKAVMSIIGAIFTAVLGYLKVRFLG